MTTSAMSAPDPMAAAIQTSYRTAVSDRRAWEPLWAECLDVALPNQSRLAGRRGGGGRKTDHIYDGTAMDGVDMLATSILGQVTPPWTPWFSLKPGAMVADADRDSAAQALQAITTQVFDAITRSNFTTEIHQCYLDLVTLGTACIAVDEAAPGAPSPLRFTAVPALDVVLAEGLDGRLSTVYRAVSMTVAAARLAFPDAADRFSGDAADTPPIVECVMTDGAGARRVVFLDTDDGDPIILRDQKLPASPYIAFRWQKAAGEAYGRSPVMKALPDIKTANRVVELILKDASIAVTGIWQADDDGVLNPATITLEPGTIIPKAVGSQGLKPLDMPSNFDVSQLVLSDLRTRIRAALLVDRLAPVGAGRQTATEVLERAAENALMLAGTYGRLQAELLVPLLDRIFAVMARRGLIPTMDTDGDPVALDIRSPISAIQTQRTISSLAALLDAAKKLGDAAMAVIDGPAVIKRIAVDLGLSADLLTPQPQPQSSTGA